MDSPHRSTVPLFDDRARCRGRCTRRGGRSADGKNRVNDRTAPPLAGLSTRWASGAISFASRGARIGYTKAQTGAAGELGDASSGCGAWSTHEVRPHRVASGAAECAEEGAMKPRIVHVPAWYSPWSASCTNRGDNPQGGNMNHRDRRDGHALSGAVTGIVAGAGGHRGAEHRHLRRHGATRTPGERGADENRRGDC